jgi:hypothetical protein
MKLKLIIIILLSGASLSGGGYYYYQYYYTETLMLSEIVGHTDNDVVNILVNMADFDTGLTRHDINYLKTNKDYWINRMNEVNAITDSELKKQANIKLLADMMENSTMKKVCRIITFNGLNIAVNILETIM